ncbi:MAG TPA: nitronate monooxygenase [Thermoanaerobaculia bacterium]|jgi:nitronate monooxygenase|nr:nitronate monooxygenase [Thermoanaerobaculia bacterium]
MWTSTRFTERIGCRYPIVQGPMGGGASTPELVAAVANAGGFGSLGAYHLEPAEILRAAAEIRRLTDKPFALNLWIPRSQEDSGHQEGDAARALARLQPYRDELGLPPLAAPPAPGVQDFERQFEAVLQVRPAAFSFIFGLLPAPMAAAARKQGILMIGTATTVEETEALEASGVDMVCASGFEAGGHRGSFLRPAEESLTGTLPLIPQVVSAVRVPVLAAGGIADGRGVAAALVLGADAAQIGTAFLMCRESGANALHRAALADRERARRTALTRAFTGRLARVLANRFTEEMAQPPSELLPYPLQNAITREIRLAAARAGRDDLLGLYGGQGASLASPRLAGDLVAALAAETGAALARFCG